MNKIIKSTIMGLGLTLALPLTSVKSFAQSDLAVFGLKGNVQKVKYTNTDIFAHTVPDGPVSYREVTFNRNGKLTSVDGKNVSNNANFQFVRDAQGRINKVIKVEQGEDIHEKFVTTYTDVITYDANGRKTMVKTNEKISNGITDDYSYKYFYDSQGRILGEGSSSSGYQIVGKFTNYQTDSQGNWIKCIYADGISDKESVTREITYYTGDASQSILDFDVAAPKTLVTAKGNYANIREEPSLKADYVKEWSGTDSWNATLNNYELLSATDAGNGWWKTVRGYISKTVTKAVPAAPALEDRVNQHFTGYHGDDMDDWGGWRIARNKATGLVLCELDSNPSQGLYLGKEINGVFCFKYFVICYPEYDANAKLNLEKEVTTDEATGVKTVSYNLKYGPAYVKRVKNPDYDPNGNAHSMSEYFTYLDLSRLPKNLIEDLFKAEIEDENVKEFYVDGYMTSSKFEYPWTQY